MRKVIGMMLVLLSTLSAVCQPAPTYQLATITNVSAYKAKNDKSKPVSYDVSVKAGSTVYVVRYTPPFGETTVLYVAGRQLLILIGKDTITYHDILGQSFEVPIMSRTPIEAPVVGNTPAEVAVGRLRSVNSDKRSK